MNLISIIINYLKHSRELLPCQIQDVAAAEELRSVHLATDAAPERRNVTESAHAVIALTNT